MFGWFSGKKEVKRVEEDTKRGFESVKKDIREVKEVLATVQEELDGIKNVLSIMNELKNKQVFKTPKQVFDKQTGVYAVQTPVQTGVETPNLGQFSVTERAILWILLNSDMRLSYDDLAAMLGKERSTIRGQINRIKQKNESLVEEVVEKNGKKRVFIPEEIREKMLKKSKVSINPGKKAQRNIKGAEKDE